MKRRSWVLVRRMRADGGRARTRSKGGEWDVPVTRRACGEEGMLVLVSTV